MNIEAFFQTHAYLVSHINETVHRSLMDRIDWERPLIGVRGSRGVGKTTFLLTYAKHFFDLQQRQCLYVNMNNFFFQGRGIVDFAGEFVQKGGRTLLLDQVFKLPDWCEEVMTCRRLYPSLHIVYATSTVDHDNLPMAEELSDASDIYYLHGFSFREFVNSQTGKEFRGYTLDEVLHDHEHILRSTLSSVRPWTLFQDYLHHGYYPFFLESHNFTENLLKSVNMIIEVDILFLKQTELKSLSRLKKLLYLLAAEGITLPNVSTLAENVGISRSTVMNYIKNLEEARLIHLVYNEGDFFPKKPAQIMMHNTNLLYALYPHELQQNEIMETFFTNSLWRHHKVNRGKRDGFYRVDGIDICVCDKQQHLRGSEDMIRARYNAEVGRGNDIPLWLFGFLV